MVFARVSFAPMSRLCATDHIQKKGHVWIVHTSVSQNNTKTRALRPENEHRGAEGVGLAISDTVLVSRTRAALVGDGFRQNRKAMTIQVPGSSS